MTSWFSSRARYIDTAFEPYATADVDLDGRITLDELHETSAPDDEYQSLGERMYLGLVPRLPRLDNPGCRGNSIGWSGYGQLRQADRLTRRNTA